MCHWYTSSKMPSWYVRVIIFCYLKEFTVSCYIIDLYGLVLFLGVEPYSLLPWYNQLVWKPFLEGRESAMVSLFSKIMWRSSKADVAKEVRGGERERERDDNLVLFLSPAWTA